MNFLIKPWAHVVSTIFYKGFYKELDKNNFILYKIIDSFVVEGKESYKIQCINTKAIFSTTIQEIIFDLDILHGLHPIQGCFVGIEYAKFIKSPNNNLKSQEIQKIS